MADKDEEVTGECTPEEAKGKEAKKIAALYESNMKTLVALFGDTNLLSGKIKFDKDQTHTLMDEVFKEEAEEAGKSFKEKAKKLIKSKIAFDKFIEQKTKEFNDAVTQKKKEFNVEMGEAFGLLKNVDQMKKDFQRSIPEGPTAPVDNSNKA